MIKQQQDELIRSLHRSVEHIVSAYRLIRAVPPPLEAASLLDYAKLIQQLLLELYQTIPKLCVPMSLFKKVEKESLESGEVVERMVREQRKAAVEMEVLEQRVKEGEGRERYLKESYEQMLKNNHYYKKKAQSLKKSGEQSIKNVLEVVNSRHEDGRISLPRLDKRQKLSLLWLIGPKTNHNQKLVNHLLSRG